MTIRHKLDEIGLSPENPVVIGSGILQALGLRTSDDIDLVVTPEAYVELKKSGRYRLVENHGRELLENDIFEIGPDWGVLGKAQAFGDLRENSRVVDGVRYITVEFLLAVKTSWLNDDDDVRQKDIDDVRLIEKYLSRTGNKSRA